MFKVIVERPRPSNPIRIKKEIIKEDGDNLPKQESMSKKYSLYWGERLNENLSPLKRFLRSKIGQPWNKVWSEICENLNSNSAVKKHVRDHVSDYIFQNVRMIEGKPYCVHKYSTGRRWEPLYTYSEGLSLYVDPETGLLNPAPKFKPKKKTKKERIISFNDGATIEVHGRIWYYVERRIHQVPEYVIDYTQRDPVTKRYNRTHLIYRNKEEKVYTQLNKKYIKTLKRWLSTGLWGPPKKKNRTKHFKKPV